MWQIKIGNECNRDFTGRRAYSKWLDLTVERFLLIIIVIWLQTGYAMVILSSAIKGVPAGINEAARIDGATEIKPFLNHYFSSEHALTDHHYHRDLQLSFDIVRVMTGGNNGTKRDLIGFTADFHLYRCWQVSAIAIVLLLLVAIIFNNVNQFNKSKGFTMAENPKAAKQKSTFWNNFTS